MQQEFDPLSKSEVIIVYIAMALSGMFVGVLLGIALGWLWWG